MTVETAAQAAYIVAALLFILALAGLSHHESAKLGNTFGIAGMTVALVATIALAIDRDLSGAGLALLVVAMLGGCGDRAVAGPGGRDDRDARADRPAALVRGSGRGAGRLERLPARRGRPRRRRGRGPADAGPDGIHSAEVFIGVFIGAVTFTGSVVAFLKLSARIKSSPLMLPGKNALNLGALGAFVVLTVWFVIDPQLWLLGSGHRYRPRARLAPCRLDRRRRHARRGFDAQLATRAGPRPLRDSCSRTTC